MHILLAVIDGGLLRSSLVFRMTLLNLSIQYSPDNREISTEERRILRFNYPKTNKITIWPLSKTRAGKHFFSRFLGVEILMAIAIFNSFKYFSLPVHLFLILNQYVCALQMRNWQQMFLNKKEYSVLNHSFYSAWYTWKNRTDISLKSFSIIGLYFRVICLHIISTTIFRRLR